MLFCFLFLRTLSHYIEAVITSLMGSEHMREHFKMKATIVGWRSQLHSKTQIFCPVTHAHISFNIHMNRLKGERERVREREREREREWIEHNRPHKIPSLQNCHHKTTLLRLQYLVKMVFLSPSKSVNLRGNKDLWRRLFHIHHFLMIASAQPSSFVLPF